MTTLKEMRDLYLNISSAIACSESSEQLAKIEAQTANYKKNIEYLPVWEWQRECNSYYQSLIMANNQQAKHINLKIENND